MVKSAQHYRPKNFQKLATILLDCDCKGSSGDLSSFGFSSSFDSFSSFCVFFAANCLVLTLSSFALDICFCVVSSCSGVSCPADGMVGSGGICSGGS